MGREEEQQPLWSEQPSEPDELESSFEQARQAWMEIRFQHAIGSPEEEQYWTAYRSASDRIWKRVHHRG